MLKTQREVFLITFVLFTLLLGVYFLTAGEGMYSMDGEMLFMVSWNLANHGTFSVSCNSGVPGRDGLCFSNYEFFMPLASTPLVWAAKVVNRLVLYQDDIAVARFFVARFNQIITALCGAMLFNVARRFYKDYLVSVIIALLYSIGTFAWPYAKFHFREPLTALTLIVGVFSLVSFFQSYHVRWLYWSCLNFALATFTRVSSLFCFIGVLLYVEYKLRQSVEERVKRRDIRQLCWGAFLMTLAVIAFYNWYRFGSIIDFGYPGETWDTPLLEGLYGLLLSPGKGIFWYAPVLIPGICGLAKMYYTSWRPEALLFFAFISSYLIFHAGFWIWWGGDCWGPRYLVPMLPFIVLAIGVLLKSKFGWWLVVPFVPVSILVQILGVGIDYNYYATSIPVELQLYDWRYSPLRHSLHLFNLQEGANFLNNELSLLGLPSNGSVIWRWIWGGVLICSSIILYFSLKLRSNAK